MLMPPVNGERQLSYENAVNLIMEFGAETCQEIAQKVNIETQMDKKIKNPVGALISRLRLSKTNKREGGSRKKINNRTAKPTVTKQQQKYSEIMQGELESEYRRAWDI